MKGFLSTLALGLAAAFLWPSNSFAQEASLEAVMSEWMKYAAPGDHHKALDPLVGSWVITGKFRMSPDADWMVGESYAESKWILGGRFVQQDVWSEVADMSPVPFEGMGLLGYDNIGQQYVMSWVDNHGTLILHGEGPGDAASVTVEGSYTDPVSKGDRAFRWVYRVANPDQFVVEMYEPLPGAKMFMSGELTYNRKP